MLTAKRQILKFVYDDEAAKAAAEAKAAADAKADADAKAAADKAGKTFTQEELNTIIAKEKREFQKQNEALVVQLSEMQTEKGRSDESKTALQEQIDSLRKTYMTKEQLAKEESQKFQTEAERKFNDLESNHKTLRRKYESTQIKRELSDEAFEAGAVKPPQIVRELMETAEIVADETTGEDTVIVTMVTVDEDGKTVELKLSPKEAVKRHAEDKENWNLYKTNIVSGLGDGNQTSQEASMNDDDWFKAQMEKK